MLKRIFKSMLCGCCWGVLPVLRNVLWKVSVLGRFREIENSPINQWLMYTYNYYRHDKYEDEYLYIVYIHHYPYYQPYRLHIPSSHFAIQKFRLVLALASLARACGELGGNKVGLGVPKRLKGVRITGFVGRSKVDVYLHEWLICWSLGYIPSLPVIPLEVFPVFDRYVFLGGPIVIPPQFRRSKHPRRFLVLNCRRSNREFGTAILMTEKLIAVWRGIWFMALPIYHIWDMRLYSIFTSTR